MVQLKNYYDLHLSVSRYANNGNLAISLLTPDKRLFGQLTANLISLGNDCSACLDPAGLGIGNDFSDLDSFIRENNLGEFTGKAIPVNSKLYYLYDLNLPEIVKHDPEASLKPWLIKAAAEQETDYDQGWER